MSDASVVHHGKNVSQCLSGFAVDTQSTDIYPLRLRIEDAGHFLNDLGENMSAPC